jgi:hypothetical protein
MSRLPALAIASATAVALTFALGGIATAQPAGDMAACVQASLRLQAAGQAANDAADALAAAEGANLAALRANVARAQDQLDAALDAATELDPNLRPIVAAQAQLQEALRLLANAAPPGALTDAVRAAQAELRMRINAAVTACTPAPTTPAPTTSVTPTPVTPAPTSTVVVVPESAPSSSGVSTAPVGGVETGLA